MSDGKQLLKAFNGLSQEHKDEYIESLYNRYSYVCPRDEWDYYFDVQVKYYLSKNEELLNELCSREEETDVEMWNNENQYICREVGNIYMCADCNEAKELEEDKLCHYCYHYSLDNPADCWCGKEDPNDEEDEDA